MNLQQVRHLVLSSQQQGQVYPMLDAGWRYLGGVPHDAEIAELVLHGLLEVGLGGVARELLQVRRDLDRRTAEKWQERISAAPAGRISWADLNDVYRSNLALLLRRQTHLVSLDRELEHALRGVHLYRTSDDHWLLSRRRAGKYREWLPAITDYAHDRNLELPVLGHGTPIFVDGITLGPLIDKLHEATASIGVNQSLAVFLVDRDPAHLAAWLHVADRSKLLSDERVYVLCGPQALELLEQLLDEQEDLAGAPACVITPPAAASLKKELMGLHEGVLKRRREAFIDVWGQLQQRYARRDVTYWRERLQDKGPIMAMTSRATTMLQYSARDIGHAFEELGYEFHLLIESADHRQLTGLKIARTILEVDPILFVMIDHLRYEQSNLLFNIPALTWIQDPLPNLLCERAGASIGPLDFVCGYYRDRLLKEFGYPESQFIVAPLPVSTRTFHDGPVPADQGDEFDCDIVYVGHMPGTLASHYERWRADSPPALRPILEVVYQRVMNKLDTSQNISLPAPFLRGILDELGATMDPVVFENLAYGFAYRLYDLGYRQQTLTWVGEWAKRTGRLFRIYGKNWHDHPRLKEFAVGPVAHGEPLRRLYRGARLVLQCIPGGFMHQRSYEAIACGALVLVRYSPKDFHQVSVEEWTTRAASGEFLDSSATEFPGLVSLVFHDSGEFEELAEKYLQDQRARLESLTPIRSVVLQKYTYHSVLERIMGEIKQRLGANAAVASAPQTCVGNGIPTERTCT